MHNVRPMVTRGWGVALVLLAACGAPSTPAAGRPADQASPGAGGPSRPGATAPAAGPGRARAVPRTENVALAPEFQGVNARAGMVCGPAFVRGAPTATVRAQFVPGTDLGTVLPQSPRTLVAGAVYPTAVLVVTKAQCLDLGKDARLLMLERMSAGPTASPGPPAR